LIFWPQVFYFLTLLLIIAALSLFFFTAIAGRLWCGYTCPQTIWTELFVWVERWVEGNRQAQIKLDKGKWNSKKLLKKSTKQFLWLVLALLTGFTFVGYFSPIRELGSNILNWNLGPWETFWICFYSFATWGNAGFLREQVCIYMCPYARFQSVMFDENTLLVSYDASRGEPRARGKKRNANNEKSGDCIDCGLCVQVCPTGIDIRNGLQYECIGCAACIDACDPVMKSINKPTGLIRYTTENSLEGKATRILRPRPIIYAIILAILSGVFVFGVANRSPLAFDIIRDRNSLYRVVDAQHVENVYTIKLMNKSAEANYYEITASGIPGLQVLAPRLDSVITPGSVTNIPVRIIAELEKISQKNQRIEITIKERLSTEGHSINESTNFFSP